MLANGIRALLLGTMLAAAQAGPGLAQQKTLVASLQGPIETSYGQAMQLLDTCLQEKTGGALKVDIYPDRQLGDLTETFEQVRQGTVDIAAVAPGMMAEFMPEIQVFVIPFIFRDFDHWRAVVNGPVGAEIAGMTTDKVGVDVIGYYGGSIRQLLTTRPVADLGGINGLVLRLLPSDLLQTAWGALGAQVTALGLGEIYNALQLGVISGLDMEPEWIDRMKFYEPARHLALTSHEFVTRPLIFSTRAMESMSAEHQQAVRECGLASAQYEQELEYGLDQQYLDTLVKEHGMTTTEIDKATFAARVAEAVEPFIERSGMSDLRAKIEAAGK